MTGQGEEDATLSENLQDNQGARHYIELFPFFYVESRVQIRTRLPHPPKKAMTMTDL